MKKIVCVHLYNDYSGSPLILSTVIKGFRKTGHEIDLFTCGNREGFLSNLDINYYHFPYKFFNQKYVRLVVFMLSQMILFFKMLRYWRQDVIIYINTLLPFGAGLAGKVMGKPVVYHIHETSVKPPIFKRFLKGMANYTAHSAIYVSRSLMEMEALPNVAGRVVYNGLSNDFIQKSYQPPMFSRENGGFTILMLCSLKDYKGVREFVKIAEQMPNLNFELVMNATCDEIKAYFKTLPELDNLVIFPVQKNVHLFYQRANLVLNLSNPETWVETFGMTLLEAMHYGIPCIVPPVGGPVELVEDGVNGYQADQRNLSDVIAKIKKIAMDSQLYQMMAANAEQMSKRFSMENMTEGVLDVVRQVGVKSLS